jgi:hypothetical protein
MRTLVLAFLILALSGTQLFSQWTAPRFIDSVSPPPYGSGNNLAVAIGPHRELAIAASNGNTLTCYFSMDNGRNFTRVTIDTALTYGYLAGEYPGDVLGIAFDSHSNIFVYWNHYTYDDMVGGYSFEISKSTDRGKNFSTFWSAIRDDRLSWPSLLERAPFFIDRNDQIHFIWDYLYSLMDLNGYIYTRLSAADSSIIQQVQLPTVSAMSNYSSSAELFALGDTIHVAISVIPVEYDRYRLYYLRSTDAGITFTPASIIDSLGANHPRFLELDQELHLIHTYHQDPGLSSDYDTMLVMRHRLDSSFTAPDTIFTDLGNPIGQIRIEGSDSSIFTTFRRSLPVAGVLYYEIGSTSVTPIDSFFLPDHYSPAITIDSLGGKYLVSGYQNRIYISTLNVVLGIHDNHTYSPIEFRLEQNYPNPFNPRTQISYTIDKPGFVEIAVTDILGRQVAQLVKEQKNVGKYKTFWDASGVASGVYFYSLKVRGVTQTKSMILLK